MSDPAPVDPPASATVMTVLRPMTVLNVGATDLVVKGGAGGDKTLKPGEALDTQAKPAA